MKQLLFCLLSVLTTCSLVGADPTTNAELKTVASALQSVLEKLEPKPEITFPSGATLCIAYRSQIYRIHGRSMTGEVSPDAHDQLGPSFNGFVLRIHLQDKGEINQAVTPQTLQEPYWRTDLDVTPLAGTQRQIYWGLCYGAQTDTNLLAQIRQTLYGLKDAPKKSVEPIPAR